MEKWTQKNQIMKIQVQKNNPGWKPGDAFDTSILDQMDDTLGGLDFKV